MPKPSTKLPCIQIITPRSSPTSSSQVPSYLSTSEFDPVLYREELIRKSYLSKFPIDSHEQPDYLITIGRAQKPCSIVTLEVKGQNDKSGRERLPISFILLSCSIVIVFILMFIVYLNGFVEF